MTRTRRRLSLRSRVIAGGSAFALTVVVSAVVLFSIGNTAWTSQQTAVSDFMEEQRIGDEINRRVTAQLAAITGLAPGSGPSLPPAFEAAGDQVQTQLRLYLFRDLTPDERLQLEAIGQAHRHLEVAAFRASELAFLGREEEAQEARQALFASAESFLVATEGFLALRQAGFERLQERQEATLQVIRLLAGGVAAMALLGTLFLVLLLARRVVTPLEELASASRTISEGDFSVRVREEGMDREFHTVAHAFNEMAKNLRTTTRRLESRNEELGQALKTIQQTQGELIQSEKLGAMGRMTAGLAHELNNPLASVLGYAQMLQQDIQDQASMDTGSLEREYLTPILQEAGRAQHLVRHFLGFARRGSSTLVPVHLPSVVAAVVDLRRYSFTQDGLSVEVESIPDVHVLGDEQMLKGVILNLVNNAREAMAPRGHGSLRIQGRIDGEEVVLSFLDDGPGISHPERIFEPFYTTKAPGEGTGLGLSVVHQVLEVFGGRAEGGNRPEGGAWFAITLVRRMEEEAFGEEPLPLSGSPPAHARHGTPHALDRPARALPDRDEPVYRLDLPGDSDPTVPATSPPRVLVVEDEATLRTLHGRLLRRMGLEPVLAEDAAAARRILATERVDAVLSDIKMPGESGLQFHTWLQEAHPALAARFLYVTGNVAGEDVQDLMDLNPDRFIRKPFDVGEYTCGVRALVESAPTHPSAPNVTAGGEPSGPGRRRTGPDS